MSNKDLIAKKAHTEELIFQYMKRQEITRRRNRPLFYAQHGMIKALSLQAVVINYRLKGVI